MLSETARAKVNLTLRVVGRMPNGYHALESLIAFADIGDQVCLDPDRPSGDISVSGPFAAAIEGENLVARAVAGLKAVAPAARTGAFAIDKHIPVAAGLGGGSADAAAALRLLQRLNPDLGPLDWHAIAAGLGADVPVCLASRPAMVWGAGEAMAPVERLPAIPIVLVNALAPVPADKTRRVFQTVGAAPIAAAPAGPAVPSIAGSEDLLAWLATSGNDLEAATRQIVPAMTEVQRALEAAPGSRLARMSGAGPTWFAIFADAAAASSAADIIATAHPSWWVKPAMLQPTP